MQIMTIGTTRVLFVMAVEVEYGPHLRHRFTPLFTGVGPVEAAVALTAALTDLHQHNALPDVVVSLGSAGSRGLQHTGVYQVSSVAYRDMDASAIGFDKGVTPLLDLPAVIDMPVLIADLPSASLATGASVISGQGYDQIDADMVDMETFALLRACTRFGLPLIGLRGISDGKADLTRIEDWTEYLHVIDEKLALAVDSLLSHLATKAQ